MKKMLLYCVTVILIIVLTAAFAVFADDSDYTNAEFLSSYGWVVSTRAVERCDLRLPDIPDDVYDAYNRLQKEAGLDLTPYYGSLAVRCTYIVLNYPGDISDEVRANVLCIGGKPVAGDIMTVRSDGFMHSLVYPEIN